LKSEIESRAKFDLIRYAQVWEDADLLIEALDINEGDIVLSIASAGDNSFAMLTKKPLKVYAVDLSFAQIACCELRKSMYQQLTYEEHLIFGGVVSGEMDRPTIFKQLDLADDIREYWLRNIDLIEKGFMTQGKFERYFELFRKKVLPLVHNNKTVEKLLAPKTHRERIDFYENIWNNLRWRAMFKVFFSRFVMGRLGRDKEFFKFVDGSVSDKILSRTKHALSTLDTSSNSYLHFILQGEYTTAFPHSLRKENYDEIRNNIDKIEFKQMSIEQFASEFDKKINAFNLSDIFEYMTQDGMDTLYETMLQKSANGARFAYWNMLAPRKCSDSLSKKYGVKTIDAQNTNFLMKDKAFFYSKFYLDKVEQ